MTYDPNNPWRSIDRAPKDATWVEIKIKKTQAVHRAHFAEDLSGESQPPFSGWFEKCGTYNREVPEPYAWRPIILADTNRPSTAASSVVNSSGKNDAGRVEAPISSTAQSGVLLKRKVARPAEKAG